MSYKLIINRRAQEDIYKAWDWYEHQQAGTGEALIRDLDVVLLRIQENPSLYQEVRSPMHRAPLKQFPYHLFYRVRGKTVRVIGLIHSKRDPQHWQNRMT